MRGRRFKPWVWLRVGGAFNLVAAAQGGRARRSARAADGCQFRPTARTEWRALPRQFGFVSPADNHTLKPSPTQNPLAFHPLLVSLRLSVFGVRAGDGFEL